MLLKTDLQSTSFRAVVMGLSISCHLLLILLIIPFVNSTPDQKIVPLKVVYIQSVNKIDVNPTKQLFNLPAERSRKSKNILREFIDKDIEVGKPTTSAPLLKANLNDVENPDIFLTTGKREKKKTGNLLSNAIIGSENVGNVEFEKEFKPGNVSAGRAEGITIDPQVNTDSGKTPETVDLDRKIKYRGTGSSFNFDKIAYLNRIRDKITGKWKLIVTPEKEFKVLLRLTLDRNGSLISTQIIEKTASDALYNSVVSAVNLSKPFGKLPESFRTANIFHLRFCSPQNPLKLDLMNKLSILPPPFFPSHVVLCRNIPR